MSELLIIGGIGAAIVAVVLYLARNKPTPPTPPTKPAAARKPAEGKPLSQMSSSEVLELAATYAERFGPSDPRTLVLRDEATRRLRKSVSDES